MIDQQGLQIAEKPYQGQEDQPGQAAMADQKENKRLSKIIAYMLGKAPGEFGLVPDEEGFVKIKDLLQALHDEDGWRHVRVATLNELAITLADVPFEIRENGIRSRQWESLPRPVITRTPPRCLYAWVRQKAYPHVLRKGISPSSHSRVILYADRETAEKIGRRKCGDPVTVTVHTEKTGDQGIGFYRVGEKLFLSDYIPADCFTGPPLPREKEKKTTPKKPAPPDNQPVEGTQVQAGTFFITPPPANGAPHEKSKKRKKDPDWKRERKKMNRRGG